MEEDGLTEWVEKQQTTKSSGDIAICGASTVQFTSETSPDDDDDDDDDEDGDNAENDYPDASSVFAPQEGLNNRKKVSISDQVQVQVQPVVQPVVKPEIVNPIAAVIDAQNRNYEMENLPSNDQFGGYYDSQYDDDDEIGFFQQFRSNIIQSIIILFIITIGCMLGLHIGSSILSSTYYDDLYPIDRVGLYNNPYITPVNPSSILINFPTHKTVSKSTQPFTKDLKIFDMSTDDSLMKSISQIDQIINKIEPILLQHSQPSVLDIPTTTDDYQVFINQLNTIYREYNAVVNGNNKTPKKKQSQIYTPSKIILEMDKTQYIQQYLINKIKLNGLASRFDLELNAQNFAKSQYGPTSTTVTPKGTGGYSQQELQLIAPISMISNLKTELIDIEDNFDLVIDDVTKHETDSKYLLSDSITIDTLIKVLSYYSIKHNANPTLYTTGFVTTDDDDGEALRNGLERELMGVFKDLKDEKVEFNLGKDRNVEKDAEKVSIYEQNNNDKNKNVPKFSELIKLLLSLDLTLYDVYYYQHVINNNKHGLEPFITKQHNSKGFSTKRQQNLSKSLLYNILQIKEAKTMYWLDIIQEHHRLQDSPSSQNVQSAPHFDLHLYQSYYFSLISPQSPITPIDFIPTEYHTDSLLSKVVTYPYDFHKLAENNDPPSPQLNYSEQYDEYMFFFHLSQAYHSQENHLSNLVTSPLSKSRHISSLTHFYQFHISHHIRYLLTQTVVFSAVIVVTYFALKYQDQLVDKLYTELFFQISTALLFLTALAIGAYLFSPLLLFISLLNSLSWLAITILTQITMFFQIMDLLMVQEEEDMSKYTTPPADDYTTTNTDSHLYAGGVGVDAQNPNNDLVYEPNQEAQEDKMEKREKQKKSAKRRPSLKSSRRRSAAVSESSEDEIEQKETENMDSDFDSDDEDIEPPSQFEKNPKKIQKDEKKPQKEDKAPIIEVPQYKSRITVITDPKELIAWYSKHQLLYSMNRKIPRLPGSYKLSAEEALVIHTLQQKFGYLMQITDYSWLPHQWKDYGVYDDVAVQKNMAVSPVQGSKKDDGSLLARGTKTVPIPVDILMSILWDTPNTKVLYDSTCTSVKSIHEINNHVSVQRQVYSGQRICNDRYLNIMAGWQRLRWSRLDNHKYHAHLLNVHKLPVIVSTPYYETIEAEHNDYYRQFHSIYRNRIEMFGLYDTTTDFSTFPVSTSPEMNPPSDDEVKQGYPNAPSQLHTLNPKSTDLFNILTIPQHAMQLPMQQLERSAEGFPLLDDGFAMLATSITDPKLLNLSFIKANPPDPKQTEANLVSGGFLLRACLIPYGLDKPNHLFDQKAIDEAKKMLKQVPMQTTNFIKIANEHGHKYLLGTVFCGIGRCVLPGLPAFIVKKICCTAPGLVGAVAKYLFKDQKNPKINSICVDKFSS
jgi:hypothetical protein